MTGLFHVTTSMMASWWVLKSYLFSLFLPGASWKTDNVSLFQSDGAGGHGWALLVFWISVVVVAKFLFVFHVVLVLVDTERTMSFPTWHLWA